MKSWFESLKGISTEIPHSRMQYWCIVVLLFTLHSAIEGEVENEEMQA